MAVRRYTIDELLTLRESPLVKKPEDLPAIEQWLEYVYMDKDSREKLRIPHSEAAQQQPQQQKDANPRSRAARPANNGEASPMGNFSTGQRPSLLQTRSHVSKNGGQSQVHTPGLQSLTIPCRRHCIRPAEDGVRLKQQIIPTEWYSRCSS